MSITHVATTDIIGIAKYNEIQSTIAGVMSTYGVSPASGQISTAGGLIYASQWYPLYKDINKCITHQTHANTPSVVVPAKTGSVPAATVNALADAATNAVSNVYTVGSGELQTISVSSTRTTSWNNSGDIHHIVTYDWDSDTTAGYFFAQGGYISASLSYPAASYTGHDLDWANLIDSANIELANANRRISRDYPGGTSASIAVGANSITVSFIKNTGPHYAIDIQLSTTSPAPINIDITGTSSIHRSRTTSDVWGISAPPYSSNNATKLEGGQGPVTLKKSLIASPTSLSYQFYTGDASSAAQTITLSNNGTQDIIIDHIGFTNNSGVVPIVDGTALNPDSPPYYDLRTVGRTIAAGDTYSFTLAYSSIIGELSNNSFTIYNDSEQGPITVPVTIDVIPFLLSPSSYDDALDSSVPITRTFTISRSAPYPGLDVFSVAGPGGVRDPGFTFTNNDSKSVSITFYPSGLASGTYVFRLGVGINGKNIIDHTMTVRLNLPADIHYAEWLSARAPDNAIVGISYDRIHGVNYLTLGVGLGADGVALVSGDPTASIDMARSLGAAADPHPELGPPLYAGGYDFWHGAWGSFILTYGAVICQPRSGNVATLPLTPNNYLSRSYDLTLAGGTYSWELSVDDVAWVEMDGINFTGGIGGNYRGSTTGDADFYAGYHRLTLHFINTAGPGSVAFRLWDSNGVEVWNTRTPIRANGDLAYPNWMEVYRIPLNGTASTYLSRDYLVKDCGGAGGLPYSYYFPDQSLFRVIDDGYGTVGITFNKQAANATYDYDAAQATMTSFGYLPYYYTEQQNRYSNIGSPINVTKTNYFLGFKPDSASSTGVSVNTTLLDFPVGGTYTPPAYDPGYNYGSY